MKLSKFIKSLMELSSTFSDDPEVYVCYKQSGSCGNLLVINPLTCARSNASSLLLCYDEKIYNNLSCDRYKVSKIFRSSK